ncbi:hypothetical protein [Paenibacillus harenae]|uniref:hypothetical protein n=1 Tax=Paenibacillus harenae TaxID=306543 RepID=UPI00048D21A4|nr:hypothetical protein [Paenibacillus harenae]
MIDQMGRLISCDEDALHYEFKHPNMIKVERLPREERFIHPNVTSWMTKRLSRKHDRKYGEEICIFLQEYWGPIVNFDFKDLKVGYPERGSRLPYCLYLCPSDFPKQLAIQFVGDEIVEKRCSYEQYRKYQKNEHNLTICGWYVISIIREILDENPDQFKLFLNKVIEQALPRDLVFELTLRGRSEAMKD